MYIYINVQYWIMLLQFDLNHINKVPSSWWCWRKCSSCRWYQRDNDPSSDLWFCKCAASPPQAPTGQPPTLVTYGNRAQTAPPDCSQTRLKSDQKTTPTSDSVYLSEQPLHRIRVAKRHSCYTDNKLSLIFDPKKRVICDWYIFATNPVNPGQSKSFSFGLLHSSPNLISS